MLTVFLLEKVEHWQKLSGKKAVAVGVEDDLIKTCSRGPEPDQRNPRS